MWQRATGRVGVAATRFDFFFFKEKIKGRATSSFDTSLSRGCRDALWFYCDAFPKWQRLLIAAL